MQILSVAEMTDIIRTNSAILNKIYICSDGFLYMGISGGSVIALTNNASDYYNEITRQTEAEAAGNTTINFITDIPIGSTTAETEIYSCNINPLTSNGDQVTAKYGLILTNTGGITKLIKAYFGDTEIFNSGALSISSTTNFSLTILIIRDSISSVRCIVTANNTGSATNAYSRVSKIDDLNLNNINELKITGIVGFGAVLGDITGICGTVEIKIAPTN